MLFKKIKFVLDNLITSKTRLRLLVKFFINAANKGYLRGLATEMHENTNAIRKELNNLSEAGYILREEQDSNHHHLRDVNQHLLRTNQRQQMVNRTTISGVNSCKDCMKRKYLVCSHIYIYTYVYVYTYIYVYI